MADENRCHGGDLLAVRVQNLEDRLTLIEESIQSTSECLIKLTTIQEQNTKREEQERESEERRKDSFRNATFAVCATVIAAAIVYVLGIQG